MTTRRWKHRPPGSNWGEFGEDDQYGRLNLIDREQVLAAVAEVHEGRSFCLSLPLDRPGGDYHGLGRRPPRLHPVTRGARRMYNHRADPGSTDAWCDDYVVLYTQASTHWDALAHAGHAFDADADGSDEIVYYNGYRAGEHVLDSLPDPDGGPEPLCNARALGIEKIAERCVQGRGVMIDLYASFGRERRFVGYDELMRICEAGRVEVERGDIVCLHTGLTHALLACAGKPERHVLEDSHPVLDSRDARLLRWIDESGMAALVADNFAIEGVPAQPAPETRCAEPLHELCIFKLGMPLGELWYLWELNGWLRSHRRNRFLVTAPPLRLPGAVGSPVTPVATV